MVSTRLTFRTADQPFLPQTVITLPSHLTAKVLSDFERVQAEIGQVDDQGASVSKRKTSHYPTKELENNVLALLDSE